MNLRSVLPVAAVLLFTWNCLAQSPSLSLTCPRKQARTLPQSVSVTGRLDCPGTTLTISEITVSVPGGKCPMLVTITPEHQIEEPSQNLTMVEPHGTSPIRVYRYKCETTWFGPFLLSSQCKFDQHQNAGAVLLLTTVPCR